MDVVYASHVIDKGLDRREIAREARALAAPVNDQDLIGLDFGHDLNGMSGNDYLREAPPQKAD
jgi:hypothetical protein